MNAVLVLAVVVRTIAGPTTGGGYADGIGTEAKFSTPNNAVACGGVIAGVAIETAGVDAAFLAGAGATALSAGVVVAGRTWVR